MCHSAHTIVRGQLVKVSSLFPLCGFGKKYKVGFGAWWQASLPTELSGLAWSIIVKAESQNPKGACMIHS